MTEREATDAEMLAAVERWAKARGIFRLRHQTIKRYGPRPACPWLALRITVGGVEIHHWDMATPWVVDPHTALLWALSVEAGVTVDVGACGWCGGEVMVDSGGVTPWGEGIDIPCSACRAKPGREIVEAARLLLDSLPPGWEKASEDCSPLCNDDCERCGRGDPQARDHIDVVADKLQGPGEPLGLWYALWLAGKRDDTADAVGHLHAAALRHELINYPGQSDDRTDAWTAAWERATVPCERCEETGRVTTHHTPVPGANGEMSFAALELPGPGPAARSRACPDCGGYGRVRSERG